MKTIKPRGVILTVEDRSPFVLGFESDVTRWVAAAVQDDQRPGRPRVCRIDTVFDNDGVPRRKIGLISRSLDGSKGKFVAQSREGIVAVGLHVINGAAGCDQAEEEP